MASRKPKQGRRDFRRARAGTRPPKKAILIVCEGKCTEPDYFKYLHKELRLNQKMVEVCIIGGEQCGNAPTNIVKCAKERAKERESAKATFPFESVWCVFDVEIKQHTSLAKALNQAKDLNFNVALTNPAFEYWLLLHFENTSSPLTSIAQAQKKLCKNHLKGFKKSLTDDMMKKIFPHIPDAIKRAKQRFHKHSTKKLTTSNPSTHVYKLVEELQSQGIS